MKSYKQRINNITGQLKGIEKMISEEKECVAILTQIKAVKSAVESLAKQLVDDEMEKCLSTLAEKDRNLLIKIKNYVKSN